MSSSSDTLQFCFPTHGDSILSKMNALREEHRFCDITLLLAGPQGATVQPLYFHGHRVVLAASSDFLRDQFLLHEGQAELRVGVVCSVEVGKRLLLSCYTGLLEVRYNLLFIRTLYSKNRVEYPDYSHIHILFCTMNIKPLQNRVSE